jgi:acetoin utilization deacetylase AcuC-like enzyme
MSDSWPLCEPAIQEDGRPNPAFVPSNVDIPIENKTQHQYLEKLSSGLAELGRLMPEGADLAICVNGSDPSDRDILPSTKPLQLKDSDLLARDRLVYDFLNTAAIPQLWVMAGGYGPEVYRIHAQFLNWLLSEGT